MNHLVDFALQRRARLISRYWDSVSRGRVPRTDLTPDLASYVDLIDRLHRTWETNGDADVYRTCPNEESIFAAGRHSG
jgi:hypothetical protein